jgi:hypothetical protein
LAGHWFFGLGQDHDQIVGIHAHFGGCRIPRRPPQHDSQLGIPW